MVGEFCQGIFLSARRQRGAGQRRNAADHLQPQLDHHDLSDRHVLAGGDLHGFDSWGVGEHLLQRRGGGQRRDHSGPTDAMNKLSIFIESPSNRTGVCLIIGAIPPVATLLLNGNPKEIAIALAIGQVCSGLLKILQPENTVTTAQLAQATGRVPAGPPSEPVESLH